MDLLKGKQIMVWAFMGNTHMYQAPRDYGNRIRRIGLFSFKVRATGEIYENGVSIASGSPCGHISINAPHQMAADHFQLRNQHHIQSTAGEYRWAKDTFLSQFVRIVEEYPFCDGVDIDWEKDKGYSTHAASTYMFKYMWTQSMHTTALSLSISA